MIVWSRKARPDGGYDLLTHCADGANWWDCVETMQSSLVYERVNKWSKSWSPPNGFCVVSNEIARRVSPLLGALHKNYTVRVTHDMISVGKPYAASWTCPALIAGALARLRLLYRLTTTQRQRPGTSDTQGLCRCIDGLIDSFEYAGHTSAGLRHDSSLAG
jgi:hypothetical protein